MKKRLIVAVGLVLLAITESPQARQGLQGPLPPPPRPPSQGTPPRDVRPAQTGSAVIRGRVVAADTDRPLRRARIQVSASELGGENRTTSTNADGRYEIKELPAGRYTVTVNRSGYLRLSYGQRRPFEQGKPLQVADRQVVENIDFALPRMGLITGRVFDEAGEAISGVQVFAMRSMYFERRRRLVPVAGGPPATTDDAGQYRILGLAPGSYYVRAAVRETWTVNEGSTEQVMGYAPTYFPSTTSVTDAQRVTVSLGQEGSNTDIGLVPGRAANVSGTAVDSQGRPLAGQNVGIVVEHRAAGFLLFMSAANATVGSDGTFRIKDLPPGEYKLNIRNATEIAGTTVQEAAAVPILVTGVDLDNVTLKTSAGGSITGRVITESGEAPNIPRERLRVIASLISSDHIAGPARPEDGQVKDDWTFSVAGLYGPARLRANLPDGWMLKAVLQDGRDVTDTMFDIRGGETLSDIQVVISNRIATVTGQLVDDKGAPTRDGTILVFASDPEKWSDDSRFVRSVRPDQDGKYQIRGLPPGEYLAVAIDYMEEGMWNDPEYLESIQRYGQKLVLDEAGSQTVALKLTSP